MPTTVAAILVAAELEPEGAVAWGSRVPETKPGVYVVARTANPHAQTPVMPDCPIDLPKVRQLLRVRPELLLDGDRPTANKLAKRVAGFWMPDEVVLYIGLAGTSLRGRVGQYYRTPLGMRRPHAGGWFLKLLSCLDDLTVHYSKTDDPDDAESRMIAAFCEGMSEESQAGLVDSLHPFPFANLEWPRGTRKKHGIRNATGEAEGMNASLARVRPQRTRRRRSRGARGRRRTSRRSTDTSRSNFGFVVWIP